jgi:rubredoxin
MDEFRVCPTCGYERGFHISFRRDNGSYRVIFICPECGSSFDIALHENRVEVITPVRGKDF